MIDFFLVVIATVLLALTTECVEEVTGAISNLTLERVAVLLCKVPPESFRFPLAGSLGEVDVVCVVRHAENRAGTPACLSRHVGNLQH